MPSNQLVNSAVTEKMAALMPADYSEQGAKRGSRQEFKAALAKVPDVKSSKEDELPHQSLHRTRRSESRR